MQTVVGGAVFLAMGGVAVCRVETPDVNLFIPIPTQLVDAGLLVARVAMPEQERERMRQDVEPWMPMVETVTDALADLPNGTVLVSVETAEETCASRSVGGRLTVDGRYARHRCPRFAAGEVGEADRRGSSEC